MELSTNTRSAMELRCTPIKFAKLCNKLTEEKKEIVNEMGFGQLLSIPQVKIHHDLLFELLKRYDLDSNIIKTAHGDLLIQTIHIAAALGFNSQGKEFPQDLKKYKEKLQEFRSKTLKQIEAKILDPATLGKTFKRYFLLFAHMTFLTPNQSKRPTPDQLKTIVKVNNPTSYRWAHMVHECLAQGIRDYNGEGKKKTATIKGCVHVLIVLYLHYQKYTTIKPLPPPKQPWLVIWTKEKIDQGIKAEKANPLGLIKPTTRKRKTPGQSKGKQILKITAVDSYSEDKELTLTERVSSSEDSMQEEYQKPIKQTDAKVNEGNESNKSDAEKDPWSDVYMDLCPPIDVVLDAFKIMNAALDEAHQDSIQASGQPHDNIPVNEGNPPPPQPLPVEAILDDQVYQAGTLQADDPENQENQPLKTLDPVTTEAPTFQLLGSSQLTQEIPQSIIKAAETNQPEEQVVKAIPPLLPSKTSTTEIPTFQLLHTSQSPEAM